jgi:hypothetical protein
MVMLREMFEEFGEDVCGCFPIFVRGGFGDAEVILEGSVGVVIEHWRVLGVGSTSVPDPFGCVDNFFMVFVLVGVDGCDDGIF